MYAVEFIQVSEITNESGPNEGRCEFYSLGIVRRFSLQGATLTLLTSRLLRVS